MIAARSAHAILTSRETFPQCVSAKHQSHNGGSNRDRHKKDQDPHAEGVGPKDHQ
jgi:hypothetical protein